MKKFGRYWVCVFFVSVVSLSSAHAKSMGNSVDLAVGVVADSLELEAISSRLFSHGIAGCTPAPAKLSGTCTQNGPAQIEFRFPLPASGETLTYPIQCTRRGWTFSLPWEVAFHPGVPEIRVLENGAPVQGVSLQSIKIDTSQMCGPFVAITHFEDHFFESLLWTNQNSGRISGICTEIGEAVKVTKLVSDTGAQSESTLPACRLWFSSAPISFAEVGERKEVQFRARQLGTDTVSKSLLKDTLASVTLDGVTSAGNPGEPIRSNALAKGACLDSGAAIEISVVQNTQQVSITEATCDPQGKWQAALDLSFVEPGAPFVLQTRYRDLAGNAAFAARSFTRGQVETVILSPRENSRISSSTQFSGTCSEVAGRVSLEVYSGSNLIASQDTLCAANSVWSVSGLDLRAVPSNSALTVRLQHADLREAQISLDIYSSYIKADDPNLVVLSPSAGMRSAGLPSVSGLCAHDVTVSVNQLMPMPLKTRVATLSCVDRFFSGTLDLLGSNLLRVDAYPVLSLTFDSSAGTVTVPLNFKVCGRNYSEKSGVAGYYNRAGRIDAQTGSFVLDDSGDRCRIANFTGDDLKAPKFNFDAPIADPSVLKMGNTYYITGTSNRFVNPDGNGAASVANIEIFATEDFISFRKHFDHVFYDQGGDQLGYGAAGGGGILRHNGNEYCHLWDAQLSVHPDYTDRVFVSFAAVDGRKGMLSNPNHSFCRTTQEENPMWTRLPKIRDQDTYRTEGLQTMMVASISREDFLKGNRLTDRTKPEAPSFSKNQSFHWYGYRPDGTQWSDRAGIEFSNRRIPSSVSVAQSPQVRFADEDGCYAIRPSHRYWGGARESDPAKASGVSTSTAMALGGFTFFDPLHANRGWVYYNTVEEHWGCNKEQGNSIFVHPLRSTGSDVTSRMIEFAVDGDPSELSIMAFRKNSMENMKVTDFHQEVKKTSTQGCHGYSRAENETLQMGETTNKFCVAEGPATYWYRDPKTKNSCAIFTFSYNSYTSPAYAMFYRSARSVGELLFGNTSGEPSRDPQYLAQFPSKVEKQLTFNRDAVFDGPNVAGGQIFEGPEGQPWLVAAVKTKGQTPSTQPDAEIYTDRGVVFKPLDIQCDARCDCKIAPVGWNEGPTELSLADVIKGPNSVSQYNEMKNGIRYFVTSKP